MLDINAERDFNFISVSLEAGWSERRENVGEICPREKERRHL